MLQPLDKALEHLNAWFVDTKTKMNPEIEFASNYTDATLIGITSIFRKTHTTVPNYMHFLVQRYQQNGSSPLEETEVGL